jgi:adenylate kinase
VIRKRIEVYNAETSPLLAYYQQQGKLVTLQGVGDVDAIFASVVKVLG